MSSVARKLLQVQPSAAEAASDDNFANVVLLLDGDGTSGDDNNTFTNSGSTVTTIGTTGDVGQGSFSPYGDNWSVYFDSSAANQYLQVADSSTFDATTSLCIEAWFYMTTAPGSGPNAHAIVSKWVSTSPGQRTVFIDVENTGLRVMFDIQGASNPVTIATDGGAISLGRWHHVAVTWDGSTYRAFLDGVLEGSTSNSSAPIASSQVVRVGYNTNTHYFGGYISNVRWVTNGGAVYTSNFTPPTSPLTAISGTALLLNSTNRFVDESTNNHTVTISGNPKVTPFSPFKNDDARNITTDGGSAYFVGSGDHVDITDNNDLDFGTGDFTVEFWAYFDEGTNDQDGIISKGNSGSGWQIIFANTDRLKFIRTSGTGSSPQITSSASSVVEYQWHHIALTRLGTTVTLWINGVSEGTYTDSTSWDTTSPLRIGTNRGENNDYVGYISDVRVFKGLAVYTSAFTVPSAPLSTIGGANEITGMSYSGTSFDVQSQESVVQGIRFGDSGTKMYVIGNGTDSVYQYTLTTAYDISTASYASKSFSVATQDNTPKGVAFKSDGTKMYVCGQTSRAILQYSLSTAWDVSTASYDNVSRDVSGRDTIPQDITFKPDGTRMYFCGNATDDVYQMDLSTAWDVSTATGTDKLDGDDSTVQGHVLNSDGTRLYVCGMGSDGVYQYNLSTAWDITTGTDAGFVSTASQENAPRALEINPDGTKFFVAGTQHDEIFEYDLSAVTPELLLNFQDAGIYDRSGINNLDTVGNAQIDTAVKKYGTGSMQFDGTGDILRNENPNDLALGTGDFTVEFWMNIPSVSTTQVFFDMRHNSNANSALTVFVSSGFKFYAGTSEITIGTISNDTWHHIAIVRDGSTIRSFIDGVAGGTESNTNDLTCVEFRIGARWDDGTPMTGYIDDFRITKGIARYTANFTPPTAAHGKF